MKSNGEFGGDVMAQAAECWRSGLFLDAGRLVFEGIPKDLQPKWAGTILSDVVGRTEVRSSAIEYILYLTNHREEWGKAHDAFSDARRELLQLERAKLRFFKQELLGSALSLAELVAKVTYNATDPEDEFDEDSGWWIGASLKGILDLMGDEGFSRSIMHKFYFDGE